ncbi:ShlB/FhaC/HecB family hemolysin secretion/activation protein [Termitidicoccus mucosus]|uniref:Hemin-binding protein n=2 Tax=Termitidicoccus mucosus TaxID=1184151 RepID=A0A178IK95_9BACT|nr:hemin-binding protein [Opitutaceae bacterium TSB47]
MSQARAAEGGHAGGAPDAPQYVDIFEYEVRGVHQLAAGEVEAALYPYLGEARTPGDVEGARLALEKLYQEKGYQTVAVRVPQQEVRNRTVVIEVTEGRVGRLRVKGSRYFDLERIKEQAPSIAEGEVPDFAAVTRNIVALNQHPDRRVTPSLRAGVVPGTVDIDLTVEDNLPLHGSLELNNRHSANTKPLRLNGSVSYGNLWQKEHTLGLSFQLAPQRLDDAEVYSAYYLAPIPDTPVKLLVQGVKQDSDVSSLGTFAVTGRGEIAGVQAIIALPGTERFVHSLTAGADYKHFDELLRVTGLEGGTQTPITYYPMAVNYALTLIEPKGLTQINAGLNFHLRGLGGSPREFDDKRYGSGGSYLYFRGDVSHTRELAGGWQVFGKVQGQLSSRPLISSEQFGAGGLGSVRGYLESEVMGDNAIAASLEVRTPALTLGGMLDEWRWYVFGEWAGAVLRDALPDQDWRFEIASLGAGTNFRLWKHYHGALDLGAPLLPINQTDRWDLRLTFRLWADF